MNSSPSSSVSPQLAHLSFGFDFRVGCLSRGVLAALLVAFSPTGAMAQPTTTTVVTPGGSTITSSSDTHFTVISETPASPSQSNSNNNFNSYAFPEPWHNPYDDLHPRTYEPSPFYSSPFGNSHYRNEVFGPFFLPPLLPVLGAAPPAESAPPVPGYPNDFAGEPFFMAYGNLLAHKFLSSKRTERIAHYRAKRLALVTELRARLNREQDSPSEAREHDLAGFAATQTPRLLELEAEAEQIRYDLTHENAFKTTANDIGDQSSFGEDPKHIGDLATLRLILSGAHFRDGFSPDQRRLLEEMAMETMLIIKPEQDAGSPPYVFFWPAGARIPTPKELLPDAYAKFEKIRGIKTDLKEELRAALARDDSFMFIGQRTESYVRLAASQAARFAELDILADQIRPALAAQFEAAVSPTKLPADLLRRVAPIMDRKAALQREMFARLKEFRHDLPGDRVELIKQNNGLAISVTTGRRDRAAVLARVDAINGEMATRFAALATEYDAVRDALARYQAPAPEAKTGVTVDQLAADFLAAYNTREFRNNQRDYAAAMLSSGLSPAQRRLLLTAVKENFLEQPVPSAH